MTEIEQELLNRVQASEYLITRLIAELLGREADAAAAGAAFVQSIRDDLYFAVTSRTKTPAKSDHLADEVSRLAERTANEALKRLALRKRRPRSRRAPE